MINVSLPLILMKLFFYIISKNILELVLKEALACNILYKYVLVVLKIQLAMEHTTQYTRT